MEQEIAVDRAARTAMHRAPAESGKPTFREVFAVSEFRALWLAQLLSVVGDQLARVAMTVLVFDRTHSALWTALTYAVTFLPWMIGGLALSGLADRLPRRQVMVACDVARLVLVCLMALVSLKAPPGAALWIMVTLLFMVTLLDSPFKSARSAMLPDVLPGERYVLGIAVTQTTLQVGMVSGFALGGLVVAVLGVRPALLADAATFAASALLVRFWVHQRPAAASTGLVFAAGPFGTALGAVVFGRIVPQATRQRWMGPLAVGACGLLMFCWLQPDLPGALLIITASGACASYQLAANAAFVAAVPPERRGQAFGLANGGMQVSQGLWIILAGALAASRAVTPGTVIAISGGLGAILAAALATSWRRQA